MASDTKEQIKSARGWTAQNPDGTLPEEALAANQMFTPEQLPDPQNWKDSGLAGKGQVVPSRLVLTDTDDQLSHPLGPEAGHALREQKTRAVEERLAGWAYDAEEARDTVSEVAQPDPLSRTVQEASRAQALILAGEDPEDAVEQAEQAYEDDDEAPDTGGSRSGDDDDDAEGDDDEETGPPAQSANKEEWYAYAQSQGETAEYDDITVAQMQEKYGQ